MAKSCEITKSETIKYITCDYFFKNVKCGMEKKVIIFFCKNFSNSNEENYKLNFYGAYYLILLLWKHKC